MTASNVPTTLGRDQVPATLSDTARELIKVSLRDNTRRAYRTQLRQWLAWAEQGGVSGLPADAVDVANYLAERGHAGQSPSTLRTVVAAIKAAHDGKGLDFDSKAPVIIKTLRGLTNAAPRLPQQAEPIRRDEILELLHAADASPIGLRDAALFALGYVFALRRSELVTLDLDNQGTGEGVLRITAKTIEVTFAKSKTSSGKPQSVAVPRAQNSEAVKAIEAWIELAGIVPGEPVFRRVHKGGDIGGRLHPQSVSKIVKARIAAQHERNGAPELKAHEDAARYSGHSLRVGFAVTAAEAGADIRAIAMVTRHRSLAMPARYAEKADQIRTSPGGAQSELSYQWKFGRGARCMKYLYATQAMMAATTMKRMVLMVGTLLLGVSKVPLFGRYARSHL
jgi:site-specific recombinase XerD